MTLFEHLKQLGYTKKEAKGLMNTGKVFHKSIPTSDGQRIIDPHNIEVKPRAPKMVPGRDPCIVHKDTGFVVVYKPANYLSVRAARRHKDPTITGFVHRIMGAAYTVHRLDEDTSGLMLVATNEKTQEYLKTELEKRTIKRTYLALVSGHLKREQTIKSSLVRNRGDGKRGSHHDRENGKMAITHINPKKHLKGATLVEAVIETGRTHQIRIHLSENRHPVLGDLLYAPKSIQKKSKRLALHAHTLSLKHPVSKEEMVFQAPLADDLEQLRRGLLLKKK